MVPGKSGPHARGEGEHVIALESWEGLGPSSRDEGLLFLHGLDSNLEASLQTPQEPDSPGEPGMQPRRCRGQGPHLGMTGESRGFSQGAAGFSSYDGEFRLPLVLAQGSPIFHSSFEGELGFALESLQGKSAGEPVPEQRAPGKCSVPRPGT